MQKMRRPHGVEKIDLELETQAELHGAWPMGAGQMQEAGTGQVCGRTGVVGVHSGTGSSRRGNDAVAAHGVELGVVEDIKHLPAELETHFFADGELFEEAEIEV